MKIFPTLSTAAEAELSRYDAEIAEVRAQLDIAACTPTGRRQRQRAAHVLVCLERGRALAATAAQRVWDATLAAHGSTHAGGAA